MDFCDRTQRLLRAPPHVESERGAAAREWVHDDTALGRGGAPRARTRGAALERVALPVALSQRAARATASTR